MTVETSIVIRTLNEAKHLENLMRGIHSQNYRDWEIVLVDSGSSDGTLDIAQRYGANIYHIPQEEFTFGRSLNIGCQKAAGRYLVFVSGHVWPITNNWLRNMIRPFEEPSVGMVYGRQRGTDANNLSETRDLASLFGSTSAILVDEPKGNNGNAAIRRDLWLDQPFDESLPGLEDVDWAQKIERKSYRVYYTAEAAVYHVHQESLKQVYRRHLREAIATKRMFPHNRFTRFDVVRGLPNFVLRDLLYALRHKSLKKMSKVPGVRTAQLLGIYRGLRHHQRLAIQATRALELPESYRAMVVDPVEQQPVLRWIQMPELALDQVLVRVAFAGVCACDPRELNDNSSPPQAVDAGGSFVPGHEFSGVVIQSGKEAGGLKRGQKVAGRAATQSSPTAGFGAGAYAEYVVAQAGQLQPLPQDIPLKYGIFAGPVAVCVEVMRRLDVKAGRKACVIGAGPLGNLCAQLLKTRGLQVVVIDANAHWLDLVAGRDVDTLDQPQELDDYDYIVVIDGDSHGVPTLLVNSEPPSKIFLLNAWCANQRGLASQLPLPGRAVIQSGNPQPVDWEESVRLLRAGDLRLEDHAATVKPLDACPRVWAEVKEEKHFKVLLMVSPELEHV